MDEIRKFLVSVFGITLGIALSILVMINGWGLEPRSWWWIVGIGFFGQLLALIIIKFGSSD